MKDLWIPVSGALAQQRKVEAIANNVANAATAGYKRDEVVFREYLSALEKGADIGLPEREWAPEDFYRTYGAQRAAVRVDGTFTDFKEGPLKSTGNSLDVGLAGPGFFELLTKNGIRYSRTGAFTLAASGALVNTQGDAVLSTLALPEGADSNELSQVPKAPERKISLPKGRVLINRQGEIFVNNQRVSQLSIVEFKDVHALKKEGNSYFVNNDVQNIKRTPLKTKVQQGFLEGSNVNAVAEMSELIKAHRHFDSIQKAIKAYDSMAGSGVNEITKF